MYLSEKIRYERVVCSRLSYDMHATIAMSECVCGIYIFYIAYVCRVFAQRICVCGMHSVYTKYRKRHIVVDMHGACDNVCMCVTHKHKIYICGALYVRVRMCNTYNASGMHKYRYIKKKYMRR
jgi:hypothetical protein